MIWRRVGRSLLVSLRLVDVRGRGSGGDWVPVSWLGLQGLRLIVPLVVVGIRLCHRLLVRLLCAQRNILAVLISCRRSDKDGSDGLLTRVGLAVLGCQAQLNQTEQSDQETTDVRDGLHLARQCGTEPCGEEWGVCVGDCADAVGRRREPGGGKDEKNDLAGGGVGGGGLGRCAENGARHEGEDEGQPDEPVCDLEADFEGGHDGDGADVDYDAEDDEEYPCAEERSR